MRIFTSFQIVALIYLFPVIASSQNNNAGYVLGRDKDVIIIDLGNRNTKVGDMYKIVKSGQFFIHPKTGDTIRMKDDLVANLKVQAVFDNYSEALCLPPQAIDKIEKGMALTPVKENELIKNSSGKSVAVININLMGAYSPYVGLYLADILITALQGKGDLRLIDRSTLGFQDYEKRLNSSSKIDDSEMISSGKSYGVDYFIVGSVECDVTEKQTNIPIKGIMQAAEGLSGINMGSQYMSDVKVKKLVAIATTYLKVVDVNTGEILFICKEMTRRDGESNVRLEQGALGGLQLNGGASTFMQTVSGQAANQGLTMSAQYIVDYFTGKIKQKSFTGNIVTNNKKDLAGISGNFNSGDTVYYYLIPPHTPSFVVSRSITVASLVRCRIITSYPNSYQDLIQLVDNYGKGSIIKVDQNLLLNPEQSRTYCIVDDIKSLTIGQKVIIYQGTSYTEGTIVSSPGQNFIDISYQSKTKKGETNVHRSSFGEKWNIS